MKASKPMVIKMKKKKKETKERQGDTLGIFILLSFPLLHAYLVVLLRLGPLVLGDPFLIFLVAFGFHH